MITVLRDARIFDGVSAELNDGASIVVEDDRIREITTTPHISADARVIDCRGHFLMPGLIDAIHRPMSPPPASRTVVNPRCRAPSRMTRA